MDLQRATHYSLHYTAQFIGTGTLSSLPFTVGDPKRLSSLLAIDTVIDSCRILLIQCRQRHTPRLHDMRESMMRVAPMDDSRWRRRTGLLSTFCRDQRSRAWCRPSRAHQRTSLLPCIPTREHSLTFTSRLSFLTDILSLSSSHTHTHTLLIVPCLITLTLSYTTATRLLTTSRPSTLAYHQFTATTTPQ